MDDSNDSKPNLLRSSKSSPTSTPPNETTSLIPKPNDPQSNHSTSEGETYELEEESSAKQWLSEFLLLLRGSIPVIIAYTLQNSLQTFSVLIVGRLSPEALATAAFSYMFAMSTAWLIALGGSTALDTLASSSFTGSKNQHDLGILLQRGFIVLTAFYIPVAILWACSAPIFRLLGQEEYICIDSAKFLTALIPGGLGYVYFESMKKYLQAQGMYWTLFHQMSPLTSTEIMRPGTYVLLITSPVNAALNYLFVYTFKLGLIGAPLATGISYWLSFLLLVLYSRFVAGSSCWGGWSRASYHNIGTFARLAALGIVHVGTEWWAFEIVALAAGRLGTIPLAAQSVIMTTDQVMNTIPFGIGVAASARVGNLLGARNAKGAARAANVAAWLSMVMGLLVLIVLMSVKDFYAKIFNDDIDVIRLTAEVMPYVALFQIADGLNGSCGGSLRGMGRQHIGAAVNIVSYYMGALPLGIWLAFHGWGLAGLWVGQCIALYLVGALEWIIVARSDWEHQVKKAFDRLDSGDRAEIGASDALLPEGQTNGGGGGAERADV
jgi:MATE family multidrug resistance protein